MCTSAELGDYLELWVCASACGALSMVVGRVAPPAWERMCKVVPKQATPYVRVCVDKQAIPYVQVYVNKQAPQRIL
eukprot:1150964-Pelagomonas_calceolata.AAC.16